MEDSRIVDLYWRRSGDAVTETSAKYGNYCYAIAHNLLANAQDAEECVNDTWLGAWNAMPVHRPERLGPFLGKITRSLACNRYNAAQAEKRGGGELPLVLEELGDCVPASPSAAQAAEDRQLAETCAQVSEAEETESALFRTAGDGTAWDDAQAMVLCVDDGYGGSFVLTARYFTEAAEGHGVRFRDMMDTFTVVYEGFTTSPAWVGELQTVTDQLMKAIFSDQISTVPDLLAEDTAVYGYGEDVSGDISVAAIDYTPDDDQSPISAVVSVKHRISTEDSYNYLTMELDYTGGQWLLRQAGIEK